jgi:hypothetical protein
LIKPKANDPVSHHPNTMMKNFDAVKNGNRLLKINPSETLRRNAWLASENVIFV